MEKQCSAWTVTHCVCHYVLQTPPVCIVISWRWYSLQTQILVTSTSILNVIRRLTFPCFSLFFLFFLILTSCFKSVILVSYLERIFWYCWKQFLMIMILREIDYRSVPEVKRLISPKFIPIPTFFFFWAVSRLR